MTFSVACPWVHGPERNVRSYVLKLGGTSCVSFPVGYGAREMQPEPGITESVESFWLTRDALGLNPLEAKNIFKWMLVQTIFVTGFQCRPVSSRGIAAIVSAKMSLSSKV